MCLSVNKGQLSKFSANAVYWYFLKYSPWKFGCLCLCMCLCTLARAHVYVCLRGCVFVGVGVWVFIIYTRLLVKVGGGGCV